MGRWSRRLAPRFVDWLDVPDGARWVDVGSGTGALTQTILDAAAPASVLGVEPSDGFRETAQQNVTDPRARFVGGSAERIPLADASADAVVAGLVLNFVEDPGRAVVEMARVVAADGIVGAYVWDYGDGMRILQAFWRAAMAVDPGAHARAEALRFPLAAPGPLADLWATAQLRDVRGGALEIVAAFADFDDYWQPFLAGTGPAPAYAASLRPATRAALEDKLRESLPIEADGTIRLPLRAWAVAGRAPSRGGVPA
jgi:SAM-dependent methyltransferase